MITGASLAAGGRRRPRWPRITPPRPKTWHRPPCFCARLPPFGGPGQSPASIRSVSPIPANDYLEPEELCHPPPHPSPPPRPAACCCLYGFGSMLGPGGGRGADGARAGQRACFSSGAGGRPGGDRHIRDLADAAAGAADGDGARGPSVPSPAPRPRAVELDPPRGRPRPDRRTPYRRRRSVTISAERGRPARARGRRFRHARARPDNLVGRPPPTARPAIEHGNGVPAVAGRNASFLGKSHGPADCGRPFQAGRRVGRQHPSSVARHLGRGAIAIGATTADGCGAWGFRRVVATVRGLRRFSPAALTPVRPAPPAASCGAGPRRRGAGSLGGSLAAALFRARRIAPSGPPEAWPFPEAPADGPLPWAPLG